MLTNDQRARYDRHLRLAEFGEESQEKLLGSSVLVVGAGGLGSPALLYLAAAGVGRLGIVDDDIVDRSNLQRQIVHRDDDVGTPKVESATRAVRELNPGIEVETFDCRLDEGNAREVIRRFDVVLDGADNFPTRYLVSDAAFLEGVPLVHGSVYRFEGQVSVFERDRGPCYRCLFPEPPPEGSVPSCAVAGVLGVLPGMIGTVQATEAIKLITGLGETLVGRLLRYDALAMRWSELKFARDRTCPLCGESATIRDALSVGDYCRTGEDSYSAGNPPVADDDRDGIEPLTVAQYRGLREAHEPHLLLDVREPAETEAGSIAGFHHIPLGELPNRIGELSEWRNRLVVCQCQRGARSRDAARLLRSAGFTRVANLEGGYLAWRRRD